MPTSAPVFVQPFWHAPEVHQHGQPHNSDDRAKWQHDPRWGRVTTCPSEFEQVLLHPRLHDPIIAAACPLRARSVGSEGEAAGNYRELTAPSQVGVLAGQRSSAYGVFQTSYTSRRAPWSCMLSDMSEPDPQYLKVHFRLEVEDDWPPASVESLWGIDRGAGTAELANTPSSSEVSPSETLSRPLWTRREPDGQARWSSHRRTALFA